MKRLRFMALCVLLCCALLCGCAAEETTIQIPETPEPTAAPTPRPAAYPEGERTPLELERGTEEGAYGYILYPMAVSGAQAERMDRAILERIHAEAETLGIQVFTEYRVEYNDRGLLSVVVTMGDMETNTPQTRFAITLDCASGDVCTLDYFFSAADESWRQALARLASQKAREAGLVLLRDLSAIQNDRAYYVSGSDIVLCYALYEIATYAAGMPEIRVPIADMRPYLAPGSPLLRLIEEV